MSYLLDTVGSTLFAGVLILMIITHNINVDNASRELFQNSMTQSEAIEAGKIFDYDLYKVGYRVSGAKILLADSTRFKYLADVNNDGAVDSVYYYLGNTLTAATENPNDRPVYRVLNNGTPTLCMVVCEFKMSYLDSAGNKLSYASLGSASEKAKVKTLYGKIRFESPYRVDGKYQSFVLSKAVRPKNL
jgi:hypothetical protein